MSQPGPFEEGLEREPEPPHAMRAFAAIENLIGQEDALLRIPARERTREQHDRLRAIGAELDHALEALRARASRAVQGPQAGETPH
jgi:hypothetical protein